MIAALATSVGASVLGVVVAQNVFFFIIAAVMVVAALRVVTTSNIVHAALYLVVVLAGVAAQFILLGAEFVGVTQVLVYIGAVIVLFLFGIMLTRAKVGAEDGLNHDNLAPSILTAVLLLAVMSFAVVDFAVTADAPDEITGFVVADPSTVAAAEDLFGADFGLSVHADRIDELEAARLDEAIRSAGGDNLFTVSDQVARDHDAGLKVLLVQSDFAEPPGARVVASTVGLFDDDDALVEVTLTDVNGRYHFDGGDDGLAEGEYTVRRGKDVEGADSYAAEGFRVELSSAKQIFVLDNQQTTVELVSDSIFSTYIVAFEAISVLLLAALIGAIVVARKE